MKSLSGVLPVCASFLLMGAGAVAAQPKTASQAKPATDATVTEEVVVQGQRLYEIRAAMVEAENRFFARYNELNRKDEYDISCHQAKLTGTFHETRRCYPNIVETVTSEEGRAIHESMVSNANGDTAARPRVEDPHVALARHTGAYKDNLLKLIRENPDLLALVKEREDLGQRYENERKKRLNGKAARFEWSDHP